MLSELPMDLKSTQYAKELTTAIAAAVRAGEVISKNYGRTIQAKEKGVADLVTEIDLEADKLIQERLRKDFSDIPILSEEGADQGLATKGLQWIIDPLDGTIAFVFQVGPHVPAVLIALCKDGEAVISVAHFPLTNEVFCAMKGHGAYHNGKKLNPITGSFKLKSAWTVLNPYGDSSQESSNFTTLFRNLRSARGSGLVTCEAAHSGMGCRIVAPESKQHVVIHDNNAQKVKQGPWDTIPIQLIVEEAGGVVWNLKGKRYSALSPEPLILAASQSLASEVLTLLK